MSGLGCRTQDCGAQNLGWAGSGLDLFSETAEIGAGASPGLEIVYLLIGRGGKLFGVISQTQSCV